MVRIDIAWPLVSDIPGLACATANIRYNSSISLSINLANSSWPSLAGFHPRALVRPVRWGTVLTIVAGAAVSLGLAGDGWPVARLDAAALAQQRAMAGRQIDALEARVGAAAAVGVDQVDLAPVRGQLVVLRREEIRAASPGDVRSVAAQTVSLDGQVIALERAQQMENAAVQAAAEELSTQYAGRPDAMRAAGRAVLASGRNDATVAAFLKIGIGRTAGLMERFAALIPATDPGQAAVGVAGVERYGPLVHNALLAQLPPQVIVVSLNGQRLQAFDHGRLVRDTLVTTGRPELPTDVGRMQVVRKSSPWTMQSPWPKGSAYWYPDTKVQMVLWFTTTGEGIHDAAWEPASAYGPGSPSGPFASHGCIHAATDVMNFLFSWATVGTPVVVYPGDGASVAAQTAQQSVDALGRPLGSQPSGV